MSKSNDVVAALAEKPIALTTFESCDYGSANRYQTSVVRGEDELLFWGLGAELNVGDLVAMYVPNSRLVPENDRMAISRVYSILHIMEKKEDQCVENRQDVEKKRNKKKKKKWSHYVFLSQPLVFAPFRFCRISQKLEIKSTKIRDLGRTGEQWSDGRAQKFWSYIFRRQRYLKSQARKKLLADPTCVYDVAISYYGSDWTEARRLKRSFEHAGLRTFLVTSPGKLDVEDESALEELLEPVYKNCRVAVFLTEPPVCECEELETGEEERKRWVRFELNSAKKGSAKIFLARFDDTRPWQQRQSSKVEKIEYQLGDEWKVVKAVFSGLSRSRRLDIKSKTRRKTNHRPKSCTTDNDDKLKK